jgi:long-chain acyl-CoA synthetase
MAASTTPSPFGSTLAEVYSRAAREHGDLPAFATKKKDAGYQALTFRELHGKGLDLATALAALGIEPRDHVAIIADNRLEWIISDYGIILAGAADVPRGTDITDQELAHIVNHSDSKAVFVENPSILARVLACDLPGVRFLVLMTGESAGENVHTLDSLLADGARRRSQGDTTAATRASAVQPDDLFTIIYTSGTTGVPKGVQLTHANICSQIANLPITLRPGDRALAILPVWHSYERAFEMFCVSRGVAVHYTSLRSLAQDLATVRPTIMASAPRLWESLYLKILSNVQSAPPIKRSLFHLAYHTTRHVRRAQLFFRGQQLDIHGRGPVENLALAAAHAIRWALSIIPSRILDAIVLKKIRAIVGGEFRGTISGGGALQPHVDEFFNFIGIPVLEGYGMTETSPVLAVRTWDNLVIGTVGPPYPHTEIRIMDLHHGGVLYPDPARPAGGRGFRGEIHVRGPQVMKGYYKDPDNTARVLRDGWMNTGDIGLVTHNDCLKILGRSKDTIVLLNGENIEPVPIEAQLAKSPLVDHCMVVGQDQKHLGALIVPSLDALRAAGLDVADLPSAAASPEAAALVEADARSLVNHEQGFKPFERIATIRLVPKAFEVGDELTNTFKLKRHVIADRHTELLDGMF